MVRVLPAPLRFWSLSVILFLLATHTQGFSWGGGRRVDRTRSSTGLSDSPQRPLVAPGFESQLPNMYAVALNELQDLESEPLCHRTAARLLVNNCQLLDGRDDATVLTDSGRAARDFVDSYAASLAICDLERGSFVIPSSCSKFRESTLAGMSAPSKPQLHVTTSEIDNCLEGLAQSDSAWNTWVSYRHKALRFCEAARADNEKDQNIKLHQRITKILARLTTQLEEEMDTRLQSLNQRLQDAGVAVEGLKPRVDHLRDGFSELEMVLQDRIVRNAQQSATFINHGLDDARHLQELLGMLIEKMRTQSEEIATAHESALEVTTQRVNNEMEVMMSTLAAVIVSSTSLQKEIENSQLRAAEVANRQEKIEMGMRRLEKLADTLLIRHEGHQERLDHAHQTASNILGVLESASSSAATLQSSISSGFGWTSWWPYVFCPVTSLVVGSYGLPPSTMRNFILVSLGEVAGLAVSLAKRHGSDFLAAITHDSRAVPHQPDTHPNSTIAFDETVHSDIKDKGNLRQLKFTQDAY